MGADYQTMTSEAAAELAIYAMMSANAYKSKAGRFRFRTEQLGWNLAETGREKHGRTARRYFLTGFAYNLYEHEDGKRVVIAFRGTDSKRDYLWANFSVPPFNFQYLQALAVVREYLARAGNDRKDVIATGHSLGGGLALCVSVHYGIPAVTFDPSPRVFDGLRDRHAPAERTIVYQKGEILDLVRKLWRKDNEVVEEKNVYECDYSEMFGDPRWFRRAKLHRGDILACGLTRQGALVDPTLAGLDFVVD